MGLNKQYINLKSTLNSLLSGELQSYYRIGYGLMFEDLESSIIHDLYLEGKSDKEILTIINDKQITEKKTMKCIKSIKETKTVKLGTIQRVADKDADVRVKTGEWKFIPKSEWKEVSRKKTEKVVTVAVEGEEVKKVRRGKNKTN